MYDPEVQEVFSVVPINATGGGRVSSGGDSTSTITGSDYPYRPFCFSSVFDLLTVSEHTSVFMVTESLWSLSAAVIGLKDK